MVERAKWTRYSIEALVVIGSILLAFSIDAWWEDSQDREEFQQLVSTLVNELNYNFAEIEEISLYRDASWDVTQKVLIAATEGIEIPQNVFDEHLADLFWWEVAEFSEGAISNFIEGGKLSLIDDPEFGLLLANVRESLIKTRRIELRDEDTTRNSLIPFFISRGSLPQLQETLDERGRPGRNDYINQQNDMRVTDRQDHRNLLDNQEFLGLIVLKAWAQSDSLSEYTYFGEDMRELLDHIEAKGY